jgi:hypothetical protein
MGIPGMIKSGFTLSIFCGGTRMHLEGHMLVLCAVLKLQKPGLGD